MNDVARNINTAKGIGLIQLGFWLYKKPDKTAAEKQRQKRLSKYSGSHWELPCCLLSSFLY